MVAAITSLSVTGGLRPPNGARSPQPGIAAFRAVGIRLSVKYFEFLGRNWSSHFSKHPRSSKETALVSSQICSPTKPSWQENVYCFRSSAKVIVVGLKVSALIFDAVQSLSLCGQVANTSVHFEIFFDSWVHGISRSTSLKFHPSVGRRLIRNPIRTIRCTVGDMASC